MAPVDADDLEAGAGRPDRRQAAMDAAPDLRAARAGDHHPPHLRRGLGLHRPVVRREPAPVPGAHRRRPDRQVRRLPLRRRLLRQHRHALGAASADAARHQVRRASRSPIRSAFRCACARPSSSASRTPSGSPPWRSPTPTAAATGRIAASTGSAGFEEGGQWAVDVPAGRHASCAIAVMAKASIPGRAKTRLSPAAHPGGGSQPQHQLPARRRRQPDRRVGARQHRGLHGVRPRRQREVLPRHPAGSDRPHRDRGAKLRRLPVPRGDDPARRRPRCRLPPQLGQPDLAYRLPHGRRHRPGRAGRSHRARALDRRRLLSPRAEAAAPPAVRGHRLEHRAGRRADACARARGRPPRSPAPLLVRRRRPRRRCACWWASCSRTAASASGEAGRRPPPGRGASSAGCSTPPISPPSSPSPCPQASSHDQPHARRRPRRASRSHGSLRWRPALVALTAAGPSAASRLRRWALMLDLRRRRRGHPAGAAARGRRRSARCPDRDSRRRAR